MKKIVLALIFLITGNKVTAQWLTQSAEGKGSFLFKGSNVSFDLAKTDLTFTISNLNTPLKVASKSDNAYWFIGGSLMAKNEESIGNLFSRGDFVPSAKLNGYTGVRLSNSYDKLYREKEKSFSTELKEEEDRLIREFISTMGNLIDDEIRINNLSDTNTKIKLLNDWKGQLTNPKKFFTYLKTYQPYGNDTIAVIIQNLLEEIKIIEKKNDKEKEELRNNLIRERDKYISKHFWRLSIFTFGGIDASSFKRVEELDTSNLSNSFIKEEYRGGQWGIGINHQINRWKFGLTYSYKETNNFNLLDKIDYKLTKATTSGNQNLIEEKLITAYSGEYSKVAINELNIDIIYNLSLGKESNTYTFLNGYLRGNFFSRKEDLLPNSYNLGLGSYFFTTKSKFLGGLYVELPDVENSFEKRKPIDKQNIRTATKRLTFGIVAKFALSSLISSQ
ncbi:hypothetical protein [Xanthocytophaga agilis]|uniref:DUF5723 domain-containing protein n=1 Tax=Xanthocytophaga agilis TaxID=3048010 RepID=A0AAE3R8S4_9BACT|nr:hypothetical protein [Xanthocytophaga agilis]MDJ1503530.1 hypothetical protein [Xanthocytophaga agilis]